MSEKSLTIEALLRGLVKHKASDLHLKAGRPPLYRINGDLVPTKLPDLTLEVVKTLAYNMMTSKQRVEFERDLQIDFGYTIPGLSRFRVNVFFQRTSVSVVVRAVPLGVPSFESLQLPPVVKDLCMKDRGLLLVTGATGSGKSTTLAAAVDYINSNKRNHIITIEDPIEFVHHDRLSSVTQREIGADAATMAMALKSALRQDPDVIMVGELRDFETIQTAITASETGHLVLGTLHTNTAAKSLDRIIDSFPAEAKNQVRLQLATTLLAVVSQRLLPKASGEGQIVACEVLVKSPSVERLILENKVEEIERIIETSATYYKMQTMNQSLANLIRAGLVTLDEGLRYSDKPEDLRLKLSGMMGGGQRDVDATDLLNQSKVVDGGEAVDDFLGQSDDLELELDVKSTKSKRSA